MGKKNEMVEYNHHKQGKWKSPCGALCTFLGVVSKGGTQAILFLFLFVLLGVGCAPCGARASAYLINVCQCRRFEF